MSWKIAVTTFVLLMTIAQGQPARAQCVLPPSSLVSWWTGDSSELDLYGVNNPSAVNAVKLVPAKVLNGFKFGTDGYIEIPASKSLANEQFTWDAWVKPEGPGPDDDDAGSTIVDQSIDDSHVSVSLQWRSNPDSRFIFAFGNVSSEMIVSKDTFPASSFYFVAGTYDGDMFRLYVNGVLEGTYKESKTIGYSLLTWEIGSADAHLRSIGHPRTWNGIIDEVEAFKGALGAATIQSIYKAGSAGTCKAPVLVTPTNEAFAPMVVGTTGPAQVVTVINNRNATVTMDGFMFTGTNSKDFEESSTTCGSMLAARRSCTVGVVFTPEASGPRKAVLDVHAVGSPRTVTLSGIGAVSTEVTLAPPSLSSLCVFTFYRGPHWFCSPPQTVSLTNAGSATLYITDIAQPADFSETNNCGSSLGPNKSCTITVSQFPPRFFCRSGTFTGAVAISDTGTGSPQQVTLNYRVGCP